MSPVPVDKELREWVDSVWESHLMKIGLQHRSRKDHAAVVEQLAQIVEARAQAIATERMGICRCWCGEQFVSVEAFMQHLGKAGHLRL